MSLSLLKNYECRLSFSQDFRHPFAEPEGNLMTVFTRVYHWTLFLARESNSHI